MPHADVVVLGAGPAGLAAGLAAARAGARTIVLEAAGTVGGLCVTRRKGDFGYDLGGHIPFVRTDARRAWLDELLDGDLVWVDRPVACVRDGQMARGRYLDQQPAGPPPAFDADTTAEEYLGARFDPAFVSTTLRPYLEKIDGVPLDRVPALRVERLLDGQAAPEGFWFPRHGIGQLMDAMAAALGDAGGELWLNARATSLRTSRGRVAAIDADGPTGATTIRTDHVVVGVPAARAAQIASPPPPADVLDPVAMRAVALVVLTIDAERMTNEAWVQVDDPAIPFSRAFETVNWSRSLVPNGRTLVGMECYCEPSPDDPVWSLSDDELVATCRDALAGPLGWLDDPSRAAPLEVLRLPRAYPVPDLRQMPAVLAPGRWLLSIHGVHLAPGAAVIEAIEAGERAVFEALADSAGARSPSPDADIV